MAFQLRGSTSRSVQARVVVSTATERTGSLRRQGRVFNVRHHHWI